MLRGTYEAFVNMNASYFLGLFTTWLHCSLSEIFSSTPRLSFYNARHVCMLRVWVVWNSLEVAGSSGKVVQTYFVVVVNSFEEIEST